MYKRKSQLLSIFILLGLILIFPGKAYADCTSPAGPAGRIDYSSSATEQVFKYCNGTDWVPWAGEPVTGAPAPQYSSSALNDLSDVDTTGFADGEVLMYSAGASGWVSGTAGGGTPNGNDGTVQYNNSGNFGGDDNLFWDDGNGRLGIKDNTPDVELDVVGDIHYTGVMTDVSDIRLKENIRPLQRPLQKLTTLNGFSFEMKGDPKHTTEYGVSAQDVQAVFPELVHQVDENGTLGVSYDGLIAPMIEAIKELKAENETLRERLDALEGQPNQQIMEQ